MHNVEVSSPTVVSDWKRVASGEPYVLARNIIIVGDSGAHIYSNSGPSQLPVAQYLVSQTEYANVHDLSEVGARPKEVQVVRISDCMGESTLALCSP